MNSHQYSLLLDAVNIVLGHKESSDSAFIKTLCNCIKEHKEFKASELTIDKALEMVKDSGFFIEGDDHD